MQDAVAATAALQAVQTGRTRRKYRRSPKVQRPRTYRTRKDPFEHVWDEVRGWLEAAPERTAKAVFEDLQQRYPGQYPCGQLRTLQHRVQAWRREVIVAFDERWRREDELTDAQAFPSTLHAVAVPLAPRIG